jgi:GxxExxY protein
MSIYQIDAEKNRLSKEILDCAFHVHTQLGPGLVEKIYEECFAHTLKKRNINFERQKYLPVYFDDTKIDAGLRLDLLVEDKVIVELKACEKIIPVHEAQLHTYLKLSGKSLGLLINFNVSSLKDGIKRIAMTKNLNKSFA